jgi:hypothetical protein
VKKILVAVVGSIATGLAGCTPPNNNTIRVSKADYEKIHVNPPAFESRTFVKKGLGCNYTAASSESVAAAAIGSFLIKEGVEYVADYLKKKAEYLNADVVVNGRALLSSEDMSFWPSSTAADSYNLSKAEFIDAAVENESAKYKYGKKILKSDDKGLLVANKKARDSAGEIYDNNNSKVVVQTTSEDLCVLVVVGEYKVGKDKVVTDENTDRKSFISDIQTNFIKSTKANVAQLENYNIALPGIKDVDLPLPLQDLNQDPSFVIEMRLIPVATKDKVVYFLSATNVFYPNPLHVGTINGPDRKLAVELTLGTNKPTIILEKVKSPAILDENFLATRYTSFESDVNTHYQTVDVKITEGPDALPTAKLEADVAAKKDDILAYLLSKLIDKDKAKEDAADQK